MIYLVSNNDVPLVGLDPAKIVGFAWNNILNRAQFALDGAAAILAVEEVSYAAWQSFTSQYQAWEARQAAPAAGAAS